MSRLTAVLGRVLDFTNPEETKRKMILIEGDQISKISSSDKQNIPPSATVMDFGNATILPGLIDCHVHISRNGEKDYIFTELQETAAFRAFKARKNALTDLRLGFTSLRTAGEKGAVDVYLRDAIEKGLTHGPRLFCAGRVLTVTGGHRDRFFAPDVKYEGISRIVNGAENFRVAVREEVKRGADWIKLIVTGGVVSPTRPEVQLMSLAEIEAATHEAHQLGCRVSAHAQGAQGIIAAVNGGVNSIEHGNLLNAEAAELMRESGVFLVPTLTATMDIIQRGPDMGLSQQVMDKAKYAWEKHVEGFEKALEYGVKIAMGSDAGGTCSFHGQNHAELELYVELGMSAKQALEAATSRAAELLGRQDTLGQLAVGMLADIVVIDGDPLKDIGVLRNVICVIKGGVRIPGNSGID
jgi:imidazolonepropionase-like amidohydrolase